jgi:glycosidase
MVLIHRVKAWVVVAILAGLVFGGCIKRQRDVIRAATVVPVGLAWVVDVDGVEPPTDPPLALVEAGDDLFAARNLRPKRWTAEDWGTQFDRSRASSLRLEWLSSRVEAQGLLALVELRPSFDNTSNGRYRWQVAVRVTVAPTNQLSHHLDERFEVPVFLRFTYEGAEEALVAAKPEVMRRLGRLLDGVLQDPEGSWELSEEEEEEEAGASWRGGGQGAAAGGEHEVEGPVYFIMVDRFANGDVSNDGELHAPDDPQGWHGGDLRGITQRLDYLQNLGVKTLWLTPLTASQQTKTGETGAFHGYWMRAPDELDPRWGDTDDLAALRDALRERGMSLILDVVTNHVAYDSPIPDRRPAWFHGQGPIEDWNDPLETVQGDVHGLPDLDQSNPEVRDWLLRGAARWMDMAQPDGFRLDAVRHVPMAFWQEYNQSVGAQGGRGFWMLGEQYDGRPEVVAETWRSGRFRQMFDFPLHFAMVDTVCGGAHYGKVGAMLSLDRVYDRPERLVTFLDNHDLPRVMSACHGDVAAVMDALALQFGMRGTPSVTYGTEAGLEGEDEPGNRSDMAFDSSSKLFKRVQKLAALRAANPQLRDARTIVLAAKAQVLAVLRLSADEAWLIVHNRRAESFSVALPDRFPAVASVQTLVGGRRDVEASVSQGHVVVPPGAMRWLSIQPKSPKALSKWLSKTSRDALVPLTVEVTGFAGDALSVVGGSPELGLWSIEEGLALQPVDGVWTAQVDVPAGAVLEFKLVADTDAWEVGQNRYAQPVHPRENVARLAWRGR